MATPIHGVARAMPKLTILTRAPAQYLVTRSHLPSLTRPRRRRLQVTMATLIPPPRKVINEWLDNQYGTDECLCIKFEQYRPGIIATVHLTIGSSFGTSEKLLTDIRSPAPATRRSSLPPMFENKPRREKPFAEDKTGKKQCLIVAAVILVILLLIAIIAIIFLAVEYKRLNWPSGMIEYL
ncbi:hypothetical protein LSH36_2038g00009 [Paralvinella palmiformis]|uniref:Uncharacterized protein n=1 Tax=Paralvinella palmiformis TaxID=53620 RepID=A0AAD9MP03_9ANNE|nr:hypothetical protein LSH36_2038g00009 [Paralvinella palmiformis]